MTVSDMFVKIIKMETTQSEMLRLIESLHELITKVGKKQDQVERDLGSVTGELSTMLSSLNKIANNHKQKMRKTMKKDDPIPKEPAEGIKEVDVIASTEVNE